MGQSSVHSGFAAELAETQKEGELYWIQRKHPIVTSRIRDQYNLKGFSGELETRVLKVSIARVRW